MADQEESAIAILRRIEPVLSGIVAEMKELRNGMVDVKVAVAGVPGRAELWAVMGVMVTLFTLPFAGVAILLPMVGKGL
jgi:hypothetical protein